MFCTNCGAKLSDDARFCHVCGASIQPKLPVEPDVPQSEDKELSIDVPEEKGEFDGVVWDAKVPAKKKPAPQDKPKKVTSKVTPKVITRIDPKPVEEEVPKKKKKGCLFWGLMFFLALVVVYVIYDFVTLH